MPKLTYDDLYKAYKGREVKAENFQRDLKKWRERARKAEEILSQYMFIDKKPDYFYSFSGSAIFNAFCNRLGLEHRLVEYVIIIGYMGTLTAFNYNIFGYRVDHHLDSLIKSGHLLKIKVPGRNKKIKRNGWVLSQKGKDIESAYQLFYDKTMVKIREGKFEPYDFADGVYYKLKRKHEKAGINKDSTGSVTVY